MDTFANRSPSTDGWTSPHAWSPPRPPPVRWVVASPDARFTGGFPSPQAASRDPEAGASTESTRILLIEDNVGDVDLVREYLDESTLDADLIVARRLGEGLALLDEHDVCCVLLDLGLPDAHGEVSVHRLRDRAPHVPVVVLTGLSDGELARACVERGAQEYLEKHRLDSRTLTQAVRLAMLRVSEARARRELVHADRLHAVGMLAAGIAHEVNNPLTYLEVNLGQLDERLAEAGADPGLSVLVGECRDGAQRIAGIIHRLNTFARADEGRWTEVRLEQVVHDARRLTEHRWRLCARYEEQLDPTPPVMANAGELTQVVVNLLINAAQAIESGEGSVIRVRTRAVGDAVELIVSDDGCGMTAHERRRAFDPFFTTKPRERGSGLGLALCQQIAAQHGGSLSVTSAPRAGAELTLRLPVRSPRRDESAPAKPVAPTGGKRRVLLVDDEPNILRAMRRLLASHHDVTTAGTGLEAVEILGAAAHFDVVLCDLIMPGMNGREVYDWIQSHRPELLPSFVLMSGGAHDEVLRTLPNARRLAKPFQTSQVLAIIDEVASALDA